jgi:MFS family permease
MREPRSRLGSHLSTIFVHALPTRNLAAASVSLAFFLLMAGANLPTVFYDSYSKRFGLTSVELGGLYSSYALVIIFALPVFGRLSDRFGRAFVLAGGMMTTAFAMLAFAVGAGLDTLYAGRILQGISVALISGPGTATLAELLDDRVRAALLSTAAIAGGSAVGPLLGAFLSQLMHGSDQLPFLVLAASAIALALSLIIFVPKEGLTPSSAGFKYREALSAICSAAFIEACAAGAFGFVVPGILMSFGPGLAGSAFDLHWPLIGGLLAFLLMGSSALTQFAIRWTGIAHPTVLGVLLVPSGLLLFVEGLAHRDVTLVAMAVVMSGAANGLTFTGSVAIINRIAPANARAFVASVLYMTLYLGQGAGPLALGFAIRAVGLQAALDSCSRVILVLALATAIPLLRRLVIHLVQRKQPGA